MVQDLDSEAILFANNENLSFNPASNVKLVTSAAVLSQLGPDFRFSTQVFGRLTGEGIIDGLYLRGSGDPTLQTADLVLLAQNLRQLGVRKVRGPLLIDASYYQGHAVPPGYLRFPSSHPFRAGIGALSLNQNVVRITISPHENLGSPAHLVVRAPSAYIKIQGAAQTSSRWTRLRAMTFAKGRWTGVSISGRIKQGSEPSMIWRRVFHPDRYAAFSFLHQLSLVGIEIEHRVARRKIPPDLPLLLEHQSEQLADIIFRGNKHSRNMVAEQLLLALGAHVFGGPATFSKSRKALDLYLRELGLRPGTYYLENGSGLSRRARISPADLVRVLQNIARDHRFGPELIASLPVAGLDGTIKQRFNGSEATGHIRAKTGTLSGISCLSGYAGYRSRRLAFTILTARVRRLGTIYRLQVAMAEALVSYLKQVEHQ